MPSTLFNAMQNNQNSLQSQLAQFKAQFGQGADPAQILQQMMQQGRFTQEQVNAAFAQAQQIIPR